MEIHLWVPQRLPSEGTSIISIFIRADDIRYLIRVKPGFVGNIWVSSALFINIEHQNNMMKE
jgi:hypothetical protein